MKKYVWSMKYILKYSTFLVNKIQIEMLLFAAIVKYFKK